MLILAIEGALGALTAALLDTESNRAWIEAAAARDALEDGLRAVDTALCAAGKRPRDLNRLAVTVGPGGFTGLRIALTYAKSLAFALGIPLVGVSCYDAIAPADMPQPSLVAVRGRAGAACVRLRADGCQEHLCDGVAAVAARVRDLAQGAELTATGMLDELGPALQAAGVRFHRADAVELPALRAARLAAAKAPEAGVHGIHPDYGERPHTTVPR